MIDGSTDNCKITIGQLGVREFKAGDEVYEYAPLPDISIWELARITPLFAVAAFPFAYFQAIRALPPECKRHFKEVKNDR